MAHIVLIRLHNLHNINKHVYFRLIIFEVTIVTIRQRQDVIETLAR